MDDDVTSGTAPVGPYPQAFLPAADPTARLEEMEGCYQPELITMGGPAPWPEAPRYWFSLPVQLLIAGEAAPIDAGMWLISPLEPVGGEPRSLEQVDVRGDSLNVRGADSELHIARGRGDLVATVRHYPASLHRVRLEEPFWVRLNRITCPP